MSDAETKRASDAWAEDWKSRKAIERSNAADRKRRSRAHRAEEIAAQKAANRQKESFMNKKLDDFVERILDNPFRAVLQQFGNQIAHHVDVRGPTGEGAQAVDLHEAGTRHHPVDGLHGGVVPLQVTHLEHPTAALGLGEQLLGLLDAGRTLPPVEISS